MQVDYSTYSDAELEQALDGVNGGKYPEVLAALKAEKAARESAPLSRLKPESKSSDVIADYASYSDVELDQALTSVDGEKYPRIEEALRTEKARRDRLGDVTSVSTSEGTVTWSDIEAHSGTEPEPVPDGVTEKNASPLSEARPTDAAADGSQASLASVSTASATVASESKPLSPVWAKRVALYILITASMPLMNSFSSLAIVPILMDLLFAVLSVGAGIGVLNNKSWGIDACIAILALQVMRVTAFGVTLSMMSALGFLLYVGDGGNIGFSLTFNPHVALFERTPGFFIGVNTFSIVMIAVLLSVRRGMQR
ncbi:MAG: hypothetical protein AAF290_15155 [Pseudomonadota bacterium]